MSSTAVQRRTDGGIHRRVEDIVGMPISIALRGAATPPLPKVTRPDMK
jgi:hypothetical protein